MSLAEGEARATVREDEGSTAPEAGAAATASGQQAAAGTDVTPADEERAVEPPADQSPADKSPGDEESAADEPAADRPPSGDLTADTASLDAAPSDTAPSDTAPSDTAPSDAAPSDAAPFDDGSTAPSAEPADADFPTVEELVSALSALAVLGTRVEDIADAAAELTRLRSRDTDLIARLHDDVTRLRSGEIAAALNPVVTGMIKLHDQMVSLGALTDPASPVGMLHTQLLQIMELTCAVKPFVASAGEKFDASHHTGAKRIPTSDPTADGTVASTIKVGFVRADGSVVRVAEVEVHRLSG